MSESNLIAEQLSKLRSNSTFKTPKNLIDSFDVKSGFEEYDTNDPPMVFLIDGDIYSYRASAVTDGKGYEVFAKSKKTGKRKKVNERYKKDIYKYCNAHGIGYDKVKTVYNPEPVSYAIHNLRKSFEQLHMAAVRKHEEPVFEVYLTGSDNFRKEVNTMYKEARKEDKKPDHLEACKQYLEDNYGAISIERLEADDLLAIRSTQLTALGIPNVIVSIDKDMLQVPGLHYNPVKEEYTEVTEVEGKLSFWTQVLTGDRVDGIEGLKGIGPVKAKKILDERSDDSVKSMYLVTLKAYVDNFNSRYKGLDPEYLNLKAVTQLTSTARQIYLLRDISETWNPPLITKEEFDETTKEIYEEESKEVREVQEQT